MNKRLATLLSDVLGIRPADLRIDLPRSAIASWDSLKQMDLVTSLEREYGIELELADIIRLDSIANIVAVLADKGIDLAD
ncbi:MAG: acyl carrier protein [Roseomonas sp.]|nr:acyl carrier protein [Roseomonas sp.]